MKENMYNDYKKAPRYRKTGWALLLVMIIGLLLLAGCVSQKKYNLALDEIASLKVDSLIQEYEYANNDYSKQSKIYDQKKDLRAQQQQIDSLESIVSRQKKQMQKASELLAEFESTEWAFESVDGKLFIDLSNEVLFPSGSDSLSSNGKELINKIATVIQDLDDVNVWVIGHTDNDPFLNEGLDNWDLSANRAIKVTRALISYDVDPKLITAAARSKYAPKANNQFELGKKLNRRTEIILEPSERVESEFYSILNY